MVGGRAAIALLAAGALAVAGCGAAGDGERARTAPTSTISDAVASERDAAQRAAAAAPDDAAVLARLVRAYVAAAYDRGNVTGNTLGAQGVAELRKAAAAWKRYVALDPRSVDVQVATLMSRAYGAAGLNERRQAIRAMTLAAEHADPPNGTLYAQLAQLQYQELRFGDGDRSAARAIELLRGGERANIRAVLRQVRAQARRQLP